ncbi:MAG: universal stress protein, partial [Acidobacteriota bacterium]
MFKLKRILLPTDFSRCADQAMAQAVYLARKHEAEIYMLNVSVLYAMDFIGDVKDIYAELKDHALDHMRAAIVEHNAIDLKITMLSSPSTSVSTRILEYAQASEIDLIVMGTHGRHGLGHLFLGSITEQVVRQATCPVLTIRESSESKPAQPFSKILAPIDFSSYSHKALVYAKELAAFYGAQLQLLHVVEEPIYPAFYALEGFFTTNMIQAIKTEAKKEMGLLLRKTEGPEIASEIHIINGRAGHEIAKFA